VGRKRHLQIKQQEYFLRRFLKQKQGNLRKNNQHN
jgi:hypothetical protein